MRIFIHIILISQISRALYGQEVCPIGKRIGPVLRTLDIHSYQYDNHMELKDLICYNELSLGYYSTLTLSHPEYDRTYELDIRGYNCERDVLCMRLNAVTWINRHFFDDMLDDDYYLNSLANPKDLYFYSESKENNVIGIEWNPDDDQVCFIESVWEGLDRLYCLSLYYPEIELDRRSFFLSQVPPPPPPTL